MRFVKAMVHIMQNAEKVTQAYAFALFSAFLIIKFYLKQLIANTFNSFK